MKARALIVLVIGALIIMGLFDFVRCKKPERVIYRLVWFELEIAPASYRFAIIPEQPILIGYENENGENGATMLIRYENVPDVYERTVEIVDALVKKSGILRLPPTNPSQAFADSSMNHPSVHVRLAYADNTRWAGIYTTDAIPEPVSALLRDTKALAKQIMQEQTKDVIDGDTAHAFLDPQKNPGQKVAPSIIVKVKVLQSGKITANGQEVTFAELGTILDDLKQKNGGVWYFRESPEHEPPEALVATIKSVMDSIASRRLPVRLQPEDG